MAITLTINAADAADLQAQLSGLLFSSQVRETNVFPGMEPIAARELAIEAAAPRRGRPPKVQITPEVAERVLEEVESAAEPVTEAQPEQPVADEPQEEPAAQTVLSYDTDIKPAVLKVSQKHGRKAVEDLLASFNVEHTTKVPSEQWPEFLAAIDKILES